MMTVKKVKALRKLGEAIEQWTETGRPPKRGLTPFMRDVMIDVYYGLRDEGAAEFLTDEIWGVLTGYGINVRDKGIGFEAYL